MRRPLVALDFDEPIDVAERRDKGLFADDVFAGGEDLLDLSEVQMRRGGEVDDVDARDRRRGRRGRCRSWGTLEFGGEGLGLRGVEVADGGEVEKVRDLLEGEHVAFANAASDDRCVEFFAHKKGRTLAAPQLRREEGKLTAGVVVAMGGTAAFERRSPRPEEI